MSAVRLCGACSNPFKHVQAIQEEASLQRTCSLALGPGHRGRKPWTKPRRGGTLPFALFIPAAFQMLTGYDF